VSLHDEKKLGKFFFKGDVVTRFWYTLKNLDPIIASKNGFHHKTLVQMAHLG
jgi:hypothetical protein